MSCKTCSGPGPDQCVACPESWLLLNGECRPDCPVNYYKTEFGCQKCHAKCRNCPGNSQYCYLKEVVLDVSQFLECKTQDDKRKINVEALLLSAQPVSSLQFVNPFNFITVLAIIACLCIIILFVVIFLVLQVS